jgi:hypothetical protein
MTNDVRCTRGIRFRIAMAKAAFSKKKDVSTRKCKLNLREKILKCYIWSRNLNTSKVDQKYLEGFEMWC